MIRASTDVRRPEVVSRLPALAGGDRLSLYADMGVARDQAGGEHCRGVPLALRLLVVTMVVRHRPVGAEDADSNTSQKRRMGTALGAPRGANTAGAHASTPTSPTTSSTPR